LVIKIRAVGHGFLRTIQETRPKADYKRESDFPTAIGTKIASRDPQPGHHGETSLWLTLLMKNHDVVDNETGFTSNHKPHCDSFCFVMVRSMQDVYASDRSSKA
jgi:hypothetical protein